MPYYSLRTANGIFDRIYRIYRIYRITTAAAHECANPNDIIL
jgi:hypothetical protein